MSFDVIVVGAGSAGAVVAARLTQNSGRRVLLIEAGENYTSAETPDAIKGPNFAMAVGLGRYHWPELLATLTDQQPPSLYLSGRGVGGTSSINAQGAVRGAPADFDAWARAGCDGWGWQDVLPAYCKLERDCDFADRAYHGGRGPIPISRHQDGAWGSVSRAFREAVTSLGYAWSEDVNAPDSTGISPISWNRIKGTRVSTNDAYLEPARACENLRIMANTEVLRLAFSGSRVIGVEVRERSSAARVIEAAEVILCAGAIHSPAILLRSGIGSADELRDHGIPMVANLPGVGRNLQEHPMLWLTVPLNLNAVASSPEILPANCILRFSLKRGGHSNGVELMPLDRTPMEVTQGGFLLTLMKPRSRGVVRLDSKAANGSPSIDFRMLSHALDIADMIAALRRLDSIAQSRPLRDITSDACRLSSGKAIEDMDNAALASWMKTACMPSFHAAGTCRMGARTDPTAVVDPSARVIGIDGLRVVDASIIPDLPAAPTHLTTVMIAELVAGRSLG
jgi:5-(hydroxymethyl)furfural/furfural oxidase